MFSAQSSVLTLTYYGGEKIVPGYNVMGICKAALDACIRMTSLPFISKIEISRLGIAPPVSTINVVPDVTGLGAITKAGEMEDVHGDVRLTDDESISTVVCLPALVSITWRIRN